MTLLLIALKSARFRRTSLVLTVVTIAISATLLLGVDKIRKESRREPLQHRLPDRSHRRSEEFADEPAALQRVPHRQRHQQRQLGDLRVDRRTGRSRLDDPDLARRLASRFSGHGDIDGLLRLLPLRQQASR